jgi:hypothetical protein
LKAQRAGRTRVVSEGVSVAKARQRLLRLEGVTAGRSYGLPSFLLGGKFFARFRDDDTVLVLQLGTIAERDVLMQMAPRVFFFTDHYRDNPAVLIRLAEVSDGLLADVLAEARQQISAKRAVKPGPSRRAAARRPRSR